MSKLIDYGRLTDLVKKHEAFMRAEELDMDEEKLLMDILKDRRDQRLQKVRAKDMIGQMPLGGLMSRIMKGKTEEDEE